MTIQDENKKKKDNEKKAKNITISHELYQEIQRNILKVFTEKKELHLKDEIEDDRTHLPI